MRYRNERNLQKKVDEFEEAGLYPHLSAKVAPPGIEGCVAWMECVLVEEILREKFSLIIGRVVNLEGNDAFFNDEGGMDCEKARPMSMILGPDGGCYTRPTSG